MGGAPKSRIGWTARSALLHRTHVAGGNAHHRLELQLGRHERRGRRAGQGRDQGQLLRRAARERIEMGQHLRGLLGRPHAKARHHGRDRMQAEAEARDDAEVAATAAQRPEQIGVLGLVGGDDRAIGQHHLGFDQVVASQAVAARQPADAAAQGEPGHAGVGDFAARRGQAMGLHGRVVVMPEQAGLGACDAAQRVHLDALHGREVDHHAAFAHRPAGDAVAAGANGQQQAVFGSEADGRGHLGRGAAAHDEGRPPVDGAIPDGAGFVVAGIAGTQDLAEARLQGLAVARMGGGKEVRVHGSNGRGPPSNRHP